MEITVNQQKFTIQDSCTLQQMIATVINTPLNGVAIAVNQEIISKTDWNNYLLKPGDTIILIKATQGG